MSAVFRGLLVDAVGTLIRIRERVPDVYARTARSFGIEAEPEAVAARLRGARIGPPPLDGVELAEIPARERAGWREVVRQALGDSAADGPCFDALWKHYSGAGAWVVIEGARAALDDARARGVATALVSNMDARLVPLLDALQLTPALDACVLPSSHGVAKPDPRAFHTALELLKVSPASSLYVGDRERDCVGAARAAGLQAVVFDPKGRGGALSRWADLAGLLRSGPLARTPESA